MAVEQRFQPTFEIEGTSEPGLVMSQDGVVYRVYADGTRVEVGAGGGGGPPSGPAGGVLGGTYPDPDFAVDMATQAELDAHEADTTSVHGIADTSVLETQAGAQAKVDAHVDDPTDAHAATAILNTPAGGISAVNVQTALNELDTEKANVASAVMDGDAAGGVLSGTFPNPGFAADMATQAELDAVAATVPSVLSYVEITSDVAITSIDTTAPDTVVTAGAITADGSTRIKITFFTPNAHIVSDAAGTVRMTFLLNEGTTELGIIGEASGVVAAADENIDVPVSLQRIFTPANGSHTYSITAAVHSNADTFSEVRAGAGGDDETYFPAFILIEECP